MPGTQRGKKLSSSEERQENSTDTVTVAPDCRDWRCESKGYQTSLGQGSRPSLAGQPGRGSVHVTVTDLTSRSTGRGGVRHTDVTSAYHTTTASTGANKATTTKSMSSVGLALNAALASLGVLIVLLIVLIVYFGYYRRRNRNSDCDSECSTGVNNYAYGKHKRLPFNAQTNRLSVILELSEHDSESQYEFVDGISRSRSSTISNRPNFLVTEHNADFGHNYMSNVPKLQVNGKKPEEEINSYDYIDPVSAYPFPTGGSVNGTTSHNYFKIDPDTNYHSNTEQASEPAANQYEKMLPENDLNQHIYTISDESLKDDRESANPDEERGEKTPHESAYNIEATDNDNQASEAASEEDDSSNNASADDDTYHSIP